MAAKKKDGTPKPVFKEIDWTLFEQLCAIQCTQAEIAGMLKVHPDTLRDRARIKYGDPSYQEIYKKLSESGKCSLRRYQWSHARTSASMAIWLGKIYLGQKEQLDEKLIAFNGKLADLLDVLGTMARPSLEKKETESEKS